MQFIKSKILFFVMCFSFIAIFFVSYSCSKDEPVKIAEVENKKVNGEDEDKNLIQNPSFETKDGQADYSGWVNILWLADSTYRPSLVGDVPPGGGSGALPLPPGITQGTIYEGYAETYITGQSGTNIYQLKGWMKNIDWTGYISIGVLSQEPQYTQFAPLKKYVSSNSANWTQYTLTDTITTQSNDTIVVRLSTDMTPIGFESQKVLFDLIELKKLKQ